MSWPDAEIAPARASGSAARRAPKRTIGPRLDEWGAAVPSAWAREVIGEPDQTE
jgi:hypothetical protein